MLSVLPAAPVAEPVRKAVEEGNGSAIESQDVSITFSFGPNGDLKSVSGNVSLMQLATVSFEAAQIAAEIRMKMRFAAVQQQAEIVSVRDKLLNERRT